MNTYPLYGLVFVVFGFLTGLVYGISMDRLRIFPYPVIKKAYQRIKRIKKTYGPWSISIYTGPSPFELQTIADIPTALLTGEDVTDIDAAYVADPFMVIDCEKYMMFFEVLNRKNRKGAIAYADSLDGKTWIYRKIVLQENFHLSYPSLIQWEDTYYLIPESSGDFSVRLYRANPFPEKWEYVGNLLSGYAYMDPTVFRYHNKWWMFVSTGSSSVLNLYFSTDLLQGWQPHPQNPVIKFNSRCSRPAGRVVEYDGKLYRLTQDDYPKYGTQVFAFEITQLTETGYTEKLASQQPIVTKSGAGWNAAGMHHVDLHQIGDKWLAAVDGRSR